MLCETREFISIVVLADQLGVSEKTVRSDLKALDCWLMEKNYSVRIVRKPGTGVMLQGEENRIQKLLLDLVQYSASSLPDKEMRQLQLILFLLESDKFITIQQAADRLFISKTTVANDLDDIEHQLAAYGLTFIRKPNLGLKLVGEEEAWRKAWRAMIYKLAIGWADTDPGQTLVRLGMLSRLEKSVIEQSLHVLESSLPFRLTEESAQHWIVDTAIVIKRLKLGRTVNLNPQELEYLQSRKEFDWVQQCTKSMEKSFAVRFTLMELGRLTSLLLGAALRTDPREVETLSGNEEVRSLVDEEAVKLAQKLISRMEQFLDFELEIDKELKTGLSLHLHALLHRLRFGIDRSNPMLQEIKRMYGYVFYFVADVLREEISDYSLLLSEDEIGYVAIHFQAAIERCRQMRLDMIGAIIVCSMGTGTSHLLTSRLRRSFPHVKVLSIVSTAELRSAIKEYRPDIVISTVPLTDYGVPTFIVSPFLTEEKHLELESFIRHSVKARNKSYGTLKSFMAPELVLLDMDANDRYEIINLLAGLLIEKGYTKQEYKKSAIERERLSSTAIGGGIAIPHGHASLVLRSVIAVGRLKEPIAWGEHVVSLVFLNAVVPEETDRSRFKELYENLSSLTLDQGRLAQLWQAATKEEFIQLL